jgi:hypothetical protein
VICYTPFGTGLTLTAKGNVPGALAAGALGVAGPDTGLLRDSVSFAGTPIRGGRAGEEPAEDGATRGHAGAGDEAAS